MAYKYIDFKENTDSVSISVSPGKEAGKINIHTEMPWRNYIGTIDVPPADSYENEWIILGKKITPTSGVKALWLKFEGSEEDENFRLDWIKFHYQ